MRVFSILMLGLGLSVFPLRALAVQSYDSSYDGYESDDESWKLYFGGLLGGGVLGQNRGLNFQYAARLGVHSQTLDFIAFGGAYYSQISIFDNGVNQTWLHLLQAEANFFFEDGRSTGDGFYFGAKVGPAIVDSSASDVTGALSPALGFEGILADYDHFDLRLGAEASYTWLFSRSYPDIFGFYGALRVALK